MTVDFEALAAVAAQVLGPNHRVRFMVGYDVCEFVVLAHTHHSGQLICGEMRVTDRMLHQEFSGRPPPPDYTLTLARAACNQIKKHIAPSKLP